MAEAGTGMKMSVNAADDIGKFELGKIEQTAVQKNYNAIMNPSKAIASTTDDVAEQVLVKSADDVAVGAVASSVDDVAAGAVAGSRQAEKQLLSGSEWNEYFQQTYGAENVQWATKGQSSTTQELSKSTPKLTNGMKMKTNDALDTASEYLGRGYKDMGGGRYVSADGTRQVRFTDSDLAPINNHAGAPHMNFEELVPNPNKPGKMQINRNYHVYLFD